MRYIVLPIALLILAGQAAAQNCRFASEARAKLSRMARDTADSNIRRGVERSEIRVKVNAAPEAVYPIVVALFAGCGFSPGPGSGGVVEAKLPRQIGWFGQYEIDAHAYVGPDPAGTEVILRGVEREYSSNQFTGTTIHPKNVTNKGQGRNYQVWVAFEDIADSLRRIAVPRQDDAQGQFTGSIASKVFYRAGCDAAKNIADSVRVMFSTETEAKKAGFIRSGAPGC